MKKFYVFALAFFVVLSNIYSIERLLLKTKDIYTGNLAVLNSEKVVFVLLGERFDFKWDQIDVIDFRSSEDEFEIELSDKSILKGSIVDQDEEFYTIGSAAGLTTIDKKKVKEIRNPKFSKFFKKIKKSALDFHIGMVPYTTFVLNDFRTSYQAFWSYELYFESTFFTSVWFGFDATFLMLTPQFGSYNDFIFIVPINFTIRYQDNFFRHKDENHPIRRLFWSLKWGFGFAPSVFTEISEKRSTTAISFSTDLDFGIKYYVAKNFGIGINTKTNLIVQKSSYIATQSAGLILEFQF
jgi:hypothetical protein